MLKRLMTCAIVGMIALGGTAAYAGDCSTDCDLTFRQGRVFEAWNSLVTYGGADPTLTRIWMPLLIDEGGSLLEDAALRIVDQRIFGAVSLYSSAGGINGMVCYGTVDFDFSSPIDPKGSNDVFLYEGYGYGDIVGQVLGDGRVVYRANWAGDSQNGLELMQCVPDQQTPIPEPDEGDQILYGPGINGEYGEYGAAYLGTPCAIEHGTKIYVGNTNFAFGATPGVLVGANIWDYDPGVGPCSGLAPDYTYDQTGAETFCNINGVTCDPGDGRQTQPIFAKVNEVYYVLFGINDTNEGGSNRPGLICVDAFEDDNAYTGAVAVLPPTGYHFVDHQATGGGSGPYENNHFEMNSAGQLVALAEKITADPTDPEDAPTWQVLLYAPVFTGDRITGFEAPLLIADAGPDDQKPEDELAGPFYYEDPEDPNDYVVWYNSISGASINERGNVAFTATYDTGVPFDPEDPESPTIWNNAAYFYDAGAATLHQVLREEDVVTYDNDGDPIAVKLGLIARDGSDAFMGVSLAKDADVMAVCFRPYDGDVQPELGGSRGVAVVSVGHAGDVDYDGDVDLSDLAALLGVYGTQFGEDETYNSQADFDLDGDIDLSDLATLLGVYGT